MKYLPAALLLFSTLLFIPTSGGNTNQDQEEKTSYTLIAYQGEAHSHLLLFETGSPRNLLASVEATLISDRKNLGLSGSLVHFDKPSSLTDPASKDGDYSCALEGFTTDDGKVVAGLSPRLNTAPNPFISRCRRQTAG